MSIDIKNRLQQGWQLQVQVEADETLAIVMVKGGDWFPIMQVNNKISPDSIVIMVEAMSKAFEEEKEPTFPDHVKEMVDALAGPRVTGIAMALILSDGNDVDVETFELAPHPITKSLLACALGRHADRLSQAAIKEPISLGGIDDVEA